MSRTDFEAAYIERYGHRPRGWNDDFQVYQDAHANGAWFGWQAGAAGIEAKAAPVGEREAAIEVAYAAVADGGWTSVKDMGIQMFQAGAAYQRQSGVVMPERKAEAVRHAYQELDFIDGWNACFDEFARLNGAGSHESQEES